MPLCTNVVVNASNYINNSPTTDGEGTFIPFNGQGNGSKVLNAAAKYYDKYLPPGTTHGIRGFYTCNMLIGYTLKDLGIWSGFSNANGNYQKLKGDSRFVEIHYIQGENAMPGDIICIQRFSKPGHNMIAYSVGSNGRITQVLTAGSGSDKNGPNHVRIMNMWLKSGPDYNNMHLFRLK